MRIGNIEVYGIIYKITNLTNGKCYIGQTINKRGFYGRYYCSGNTEIERVYNYHIKSKKQNRVYNKHLLSSIEKYGFDSFKVTPILDVAFSKEELNIKEKTYILIYDSLNNGYNHNFGGDSIGSIVMSEDTKQKISKSNKGKRRSEETRKLLSIVNTGKHHTEETKKKMSISKTGFKHSEESKKKMSEEWKANPHNYKEVICLETKEIFHTITEASKVKNCNRRSLSNCVKGKQKTCGGYHWMYYEDYLEQQNNENLEQAI